MNKIIMGILSLFMITILTGCGPTYNQFSDEDVVIINNAVQVEIDSTLCERYEFYNDTDYMDNSYVVVRLWCPEVTAGYKMVGSRIEERILSGIKDKPIQIWLFFEKYDSEEYDSYPVRRQNL